MKQRRRLGKAQRTQQPVAMLGTLRFAQPTPLELVDGWGHLKFNPNWDGNMIAFESAVEVEKVAA